LDEISASGVGSILMLFGRLSGRRVDLTPGWDVVSYTGCPERDREVESGASDP